MGEADDPHASLRAITADLALLRGDRLSERDVRLDDAARETAAVREELRLVTTAFAAQLRQMPAHIERAVAAAVATIEPAPRPLPVIADRPAPRLACVAASQWKPPARPVARHPDSLPASPIAAVAASQWKPPAGPVADLALARAPTPDLVSLFRPPAAPIASPLSKLTTTAPAWDSLPPALVRGRCRSRGLLGSAGHYPQRALDARSGAGAAARTPADRIA